MTTRVYVVSIFWLSFKILRAESLKPSQKGKRVESSFQGSLPQKETRPVEVVLGAKFRTKQGTQTDFGIMTF